MAGGCTPADSSSDTPTDDETAEPSLTYYRDELSQEDGSTLPANTIVTPGKHRALVPGFAWSRRNVDDPIFPRKGNLLTLRAKVGIWMVISVCCN